MKETDRFSNACDMDIDHFHPILRTRFSWQTGVSKLSTIPWGMLFKLLLPFYP